MLERQLRDFHVVPYSPRLTLFPPALKWLVPQPDADIIHTTPDHGPFFKRHGVPLVVTFHNLVIDTFMSRYSTLAQRLHYATDLKYFLRKSLEIADRVTAVSAFTAGLVRQELGYEGQIDVITNGVDTRNFRPTDSPSKSDKPRVLFAGNPSLRKGAHWLPEMARRLEGAATIVCTVARNTAWARRLESAGVEIAAQVPHALMPDFYRSVDALLLPTVREGDSLAVLEAMSSGLPVVASNCSSLPERVDQGKGGFLCEIGDVGGFVSAIRKLADPLLRQSMSSHNRARAEIEFDMADMAQGYADMFSETASH
jgi:glycosyltransferase involved in cell wall biosynthesis